MTTNPQSDAPRRVRRKLSITPAFYQIDMMGVVHNSQYFLWFEQGRLQVMTDVLSFEEAVERGVAMPVIENVCLYKKPARYGDALVLHTTHSIQPRYEGRLVFLHSLVHATQKVEIASGRTVTTVVDFRTNQLIRDWPEDLWRKYQALE
jgi:acyl-CoA thioester hydrolase